MADHYSSRQVPDSSGGRMATVYFLSCIALEQNKEVKQFNLQHSHKSI